MHQTSSVHGFWRRLLPVLGVIVLGTGSAAAAEKKASKAAREAGLDHQREELGVNQFTTPSIETMLTALRDLRPIPYDRVSRDLPTKHSPHRALLALNTGGLIADGFLAVTAEKQSRIEPIGRALLQQAKGLGVDDYVTRHSKGILEQAARKNWNGVRAELAGAQRDVERGMMALKDEEIAHLVALGGWWRGLEITAAIVAEGYTPERAALLIQPGVLDYFADRVSTLNPNFKRTKTWSTLDANLRTIRSLAVNEARTPPPHEAVRKIHALAKATNEALASAEE